MKNTSFELSQSARLDLLEIWNYFAEIASLDVANKVHSDIEKAILAIIRTPNIGHSRRDLTSDPSLLFYTVHSYFIIYKKNTAPLKIARIIHGARDLRIELKN